MPCLFEPKQPKFLSRVQLLHASKNMGGGSYLPKTAVARSVTKELIMKDYILARAKEPSTWRGALLLLTALGVRVSPEMTDAIVTVGLGVVGLLGVATPDK